VSPCSSPARLTVEQVVAVWFPLFGYPLAKAEAAQICQRVAERLRPSSGGVLGRNEHTTVSLLRLPARQGGADCQRVAERLRPSSWGVLGRNGVPLFPLYGYPLVKAVQICQRIAERLHPSSGGLLGRNECTVPLYHSLLLSPLFYWRILLRLSSNV
jgi:hypothetical protein